MTNNKQLQQVNDASWDMVNSLRETNRTLADSVMTLQDHNLKFAQNTFLSWMELLTHQTESVQRLQQQWRPQIQKQQAALQKLMPASGRIYMDLLRAPFSFSRQVVDATKSPTQHKQELGL
jgi:hypothetical protein